MNLLLMVYSMHALMSKKRKTREEKIIAGLRRQLESSPKIQNASAEKPKLQTSQPTRSSTFNFKPDYQINPKTTISYDYTYVKQGLIKTTFLTIVAISAFIVLYWRIN